MTKDERKKKYKIWKLLVRDYPEKYYIKGSISTIISPSYFAELYERSDSQLYADDRIDSLPHWYLEEPRFNET